MGYKTRPMLAKLSIIPRRLSGWFRSWHGNVEHLGSTYTCVKGHAHISGGWGACLILVGCRPYTPHAVKFDVWPHLRHHPDHDGHTLLTYYEKLDTAEHPARQICHIPGWLRGYLQPVTTFVGLSTGVVYPIPPAHFNTREAIIINRRKALLALNSGYDTSLTYTPIIRVKLRNDPGHTEYEAACHQHISRSLPQPSRRNPAERKQWIAKIGNKQISQAASGQVKW